MTEQDKQPEPGEYWQHKTYTQDRAYFIGRTPEGVMVWQCRCDSVEAGNVDWSDWEHLPGCTSWDWQPAEVFPQYYLPSSDCTNFVFHRRDSKKVTIGVRKDGSEWPWHYKWGHVNDLVLAQITKEHAEALVMKPTVQVPVRLWIKRDVLGMHMAVPVVARRDYAGDDMAEVVPDGNGGWYIEVNQ